MSDTELESKETAVLHRRSGDKNQALRIWEVLAQYKLAGVVIFALGYFAWNVYGNMQTQANEVFKSQQATIAAQTKSMQEMVITNAQQSQQLMIVVENNTKALGSFEKRLAVIEELVKRAISKDVRAEFAPLE